MPKVYVVLGKGVEEIEAITVIDVLRRAEFSVSIVGVDTRAIEGANGIAFEADKRLSDVSIEECDAIIFPGGEPNSTLLAKHDDVLKCVQLCAAKKIWLGAICAAPKIFLNSGILDNVPVTSYPALSETFDPEYYRTEDVVIERENRIVTSRGIGTALSFALTFVELLDSKSKRDQLAEAMVVT